MIFVPAFSRHGLTKEVLNHMAEHWREPVPHDKDVFIVDLKTLTARRVKGDFYAQNIKPRPRADRLNHGKII